MHFAASSYTAGLSYDRFLVRVMASTGGSLDQCADEMERLLNMEGGHPSPVPGPTTRAQQMEGVRKKVLLAMEVLLRNKRISASEHLVVLRLRLTVIEAVFGSVIMQCIGTAWPIVLRMFPEDRPASCLADSEGHSAAHWARN